ncbi:MAG: hypothetical protein UR31_C0004G0006 [Parcubacteria group bacterium GW2011_GWA2_33_14]|nr:MAG: hypothetical protein UR31_C0004G0006 [Parcubacteria group bacterium GW2011_GWA2_33_14]OGZ70725.1 MAG: hypothetical protein A2980_01355 [Candidatus Staskawiczbacteria bacterium RIFCSPLOWO2_01_FULL_33_13]
MAMEPKAQKFIPVASPALIGNEKKYVLDCLKTNWISSIGKYVTLFERAFSKYIGVKHALTCSNGTVALHLALLALGIKNGDEVLCPTLTYIATANSILYVGAKPVFLDCQKDTWNIDPAKIEEKITKKTKAIIIVHLYGHSCDMEDILKIAKKHNLYVIEDSAEALGSKYLLAGRQGKGKMCGSFGDIATFSFFGNKVITSGEGGMVVTNNDELAKKVALLKNQGMDTNKRYWHPVLGYNYRLTNVQSAIGLAQLENIGKFILKRRRIAKMYSRYLKNIEGITLSLEKDYTFHSYWMYCILIEKEYGVDRDRLMSLLEKQGIQTRPFFYPIHTMPAYQALHHYGLDVSEEISRKGISLPTFYDLSEDQVKYIAHQLVRLKKDIIKDKQGAEYIVKSVDSGDEKKLVSFFEVIKKHNLNNFFHPHSFDKKTAKKIVDISESGKRDLYYLVLDNKENIAGYFMLRGFDEGYFVPSFAIVVHPDYMNRGIGKQITIMAIKICERLRVGKMMIKVYEDNIVAQKIYRSLHFTFSKSDKKNELVGRLNIR